ncbi:MAG: hypothetical protein K9G76_07790 [Bacteroidales bacterium]|nr:hypothetical protein [Bacteroidales bacterium]MCF8404752.1 hypothetical protein [Bacteroidales bacterium]
MAHKIEKPTIIQSAGNKPKEIKEFFGRVNTGHKNLSIAKMISPAGWTEPAQQPEFDEYTLVLKGMLKVETRNKTFEIYAGEAIELKKGEWVRYSTPNKGGAEYVAICLPAFSPGTVNRDSE